MRNKCRGMTETPSRTLTVAALQLSLGDTDAQTNIAAVTELVATAAGQGAQLILPPELFSGPYFCTTEDEALFASARPTAEYTGPISDGQLITTIWSMISRM